MNLEHDEISRRLLRDWQWSRGYTLTELADALGVTRGAVSKWRRVPKRRVLQVEEVTGIPRYALRPDLYPIPHKNNGRT